MTDTTAGKARILAFVMAGGEGSRLRPLTAQTCKPALPFGVGHRIVDFVLSNLVNSGIDEVVVLGQYQSQALAEHLRRVWGDKGVLLTEPQQGARPYAGTADAVAQNLATVERVAPDLVAVFGADHIYRMDVGQMVQAHGARQADATVATLAVPRSQARSFGVVDVDPSLRIARFREKPAELPPGLPGRPEQVLASMGNYLFDTATLLESLDGLRRGTSDAIDFGSHVLPSLVGTHRLFAYDFESNVVPGLHPFEEPAYWRDVGTLDAYFSAHVDALGPLPRFRIANPRWPIHGQPQLPRWPLGCAASLRCSTMATDVVAGRAWLDHAWVQQGARIDDGALVERSIVMERASIGRGARLRNAIVEPGCEVAAGDSIGYDIERDRSRFPITAGGVIVVTRERMTGLQPRNQPQVHALA